MQRIKPLLSIIVPTKNREDCAFEVIKHLLSFEYKDFQVVVQNNGTTNALEKELEFVLEDPRLVYNYTGDLISIVDNFNLAVEASTGKYLCIIGDDDSINPELFKLVEWANDNNIKAIKPGLQAVYLWPNADAYSDKSIPDNGILVINRVSSRSRVYSAVSELSKLFKQGTLQYLDRHLVKLYHGIVKREFVEGIKTATGAYFKGLTPDIYMAVALSRIIDDILVIDYPFTIPGICKKSSSAESAVGKHTGVLSDAPHFNGHVDYEWAKEVAPFYSVDTIWADSALAAAKECKDVNLLKKYRLALLTSKCMKSYPEFDELILNHYNSYCFVQGISPVKSWMKLKLAGLLNPAYRLFDRFLKLIVLANGGAIPKTVISNVISIKEAQIELSNYLRLHEMNVEKVLKSISIKK